MDGNALRATVKEVVATLLGSWTMLKPSLLQTFHKLALASSPATKDIPVAEDAPIHDLTLGHVMRPSEMQAHLLTNVIPPMLVTIQALAEDSLHNHYGNERKISARIEDMVVLGHLTRTVASRAHYWRIVRNVHAHAGGRLDQRTLDEISKLILEGEALFDRFRFWGPLLDAHKDGAVPVPLIEEAVADPHTPDDRGHEMLPVTGLALPIGLAELLASADIWADGRAHCERATHDSNGSSTSSR